MKVSDVERADLASPLRAAWDAMPWWAEAEEAAGGEARKPDFASVRFFKVPFVQVGSEASVESRRVRRASPVNRSD